MFIDTLTKKEAEALGIINAEGLGFIKPQTAFKNITEQLLAEIKKGNLVWRQGWRSGVVVKGKTYGAQNYETQRPYTGGNAFFIAMKNFIGGTDYKFFLTPKQILERGAKIKKGATPFPVFVFIKNLKTEIVKRGGEETEVTTEEKGIIWYYVYPIDLVDGLKEIKRKTHKPDTFNEIIVSDADTIISNMPKAPAIKHGGDKAFYAPTPDYVQMPHKKAFKVQQEYYSVLFHELIHSTGSKKRLNRDLSGRFGDKSYAGEELIAEIGAAFLCGVCEIDYYTINNSAAYLKSWSKTVAKEIEEDPNFLKRTVFKAVRAANFIIGKTLEKHGIVKKDIAKSPGEKPFIGKEIAPNKTVKASVSKAIEDLRTLPQYKPLSAMFLGMFYSDFKNNDTIENVNGALRVKMYEKFSGKFLDVLDFDDWKKPTGIEYAQLSEEGKDLIEKIEARLKTLKAKKSGTDLFPELNGVTDAVLIFINAFLSTHNKTVSKEELLFIVSTFQTAIKNGLVKAKHPLATIANQTQDKLVSVINKLRPNEKIKIQISNKEEIESKVMGLHGLGFWNVIASAVIGKSAEYIANKHIFNKKDTEALSGIEESVLDELIHLYEAAELHKNSNKKINIGIVDSKAAQLIYDKWNIDVKKYKRVVSFSEARHIFKMHGEGNETDKQQKAVTPSDFALYPFIVNSFDIVDYEVNKQNKPTLKYTKYIGNYFIIVEEIIEKNKTLLLKTMFIKKRKPLTKANGFIGSLCAEGKTSPNIKRPKRADLVNTNLQQKTTLKTKNTLNGIEGFTRADQSPEVKAPDTYCLKGELGKLLGDIQPYKYSIVLTGDPHAGKTEFTMQLANGFSEIGKTVGAFMLEQGGLESKDTKAAIERNITAKNKQNVFVSGEAAKGIATVKEYANKFDVIIIDSWQKLGIPSTKFDTFRHEFPNTIFIVIFQQNGEGGTRGGVVADYDTPVLLKVHKVDSTFENNYVEVKKNRGNAPSLSLKYMVKAKKTVTNEI